jgi:hypothetical protein
MIVEDRMIKTGIAALAAIIVTGLGVNAASAATDVSINAVSYTSQFFDASGAVTTPTPTITNYTFPYSLQDADWYGHDLSVWILTTTVTASASSVLTVNDLGADDRVVVLINGVSTGIGAGIWNYGNGSGSMVFTPGGSSTPFTFQENGGFSPVSVGGFVDGANTITIVMNNTFNGINDCDPPAAVCGGNPAWVAFSGSLSTSASAVPEPSTWAMLGLGFLGIGAMSRRVARRSAIA